MSRLNLAMTLASEPWLAANWQHVMQAIPKDWTELDARAMLMLGHKLDRIGVKHDDDEELVKICVFLERTQLLERRGDKIRRHPRKY